MKGVFCIRVLRRFTSKNSFPLGFSKANNSFENDPNCEKKFASFKKHLNYVIMQHEGTECDFDRYVHPKDYNHPEYKAIVDQNDYLLSDPVILQILKGDSPLTNTALRKSKAEVHATRDDVVIDIEHLKIREIIFWSYYNHGKKIPDVHHVLFYGFWYNVVFLLFLAFFTIRNTVKGDALKKKLKSRLEETEIVNEFNKKSQLHKTHKSEATYIDSNPFSIDYREILMWAEKDLKVELGMSKIK